MTMQGSAIVKPEPVIKRQSIDGVSGSVHARIPSHREIETDDEILIVKDRPVKKRKTLNASRILVEEECS